MAGRKPKPTSAKVLHGTFRPDRASGSEPQPGGRPTRPRWLHGTGRRVWNRLEPELVRLGIATKVDGEALGTFCQAVADFGWCVRKLQREGRVVEDHHGTLRAHPAVGIQAKAAQLLRLLAAEFGLTPSGRVRLSTPGEPDDDDPGGLLD